MTWRSLSILILNIRTLDIVNKLCTEKTNIIQDKNQFYCNVPYFGRLTHIMSSILSIDITCLDDEVRRELFHRQKPKICYIKPWKILVHIPTNEDMKFSIISNFEARDVSCINIISVINYYLLYQCLTYFKYSKQFNPLLNANTF